MVFPFRYAQERGSRASRRGEGGGGGGERGRAGKMFFQVLGNAIFLAGFPRGSFINQRMKNR